MNNYFKNTIIHHLILSLAGNYWGTKIISIVLKGPNRVFRNRKLQDKIEIIKIIKYIDSTIFNDLKIEEINNILRQKKRHLVKIDEKSYKLVTTNFFAFLLKLFATKITPLIISISILSAALYIPLHLLKIVPAKVSDAEFDNSSFVITSEFVDDNYSPPPGRPMAPTNLRIIDSAAVFNRIKADTDGSPIRIKGDTDGIPVTKD